MSLNILKDDPDYLINNILVPAKDRFFKEGNKWRFPTYSFGVIDVKEGPALIDQAILDLQISNKLRPSPIEWNPVLEMCCRDKLQEVTKQYIDIKHLQKSLLNPKVISEYVREYGAANEDEDIITIIVPKAKFGFEVILMTLMDHSNSDRQYRKMLLDPKVMEIGMVQLPHPQFDFMNMLILKNSNKTTLERSIENTFVRNVPDGDETVIYTNNDTTTVVKHSPSKELLSPLNNLRSSYSEAKITGHDSRRPNNVIKI